MLPGRFIILIYPSLLGQKTIIFEAGIIITTQHFGVIVVTKYEYTTLTLDSKDLVMYGVTKIVIGDALGLNIGQSGRKYL